VGKFTKVLLICHQQLGRNGGISKQKAGDFEITRSSAADPGNGTLPGLPSPGCMASRQKIKYVARGH
jgi:hypothetical protein